MKDLTENRLRLSGESTAKLFYTGKRKEYADALLDDSFL